MSNLQQERFSGEKLRCRPKHEKLARNRREKTENYGTDKNNDHRRPIKHGHVGLRTKVAHRLELLGARGVPRVHVREGGPK